MVDTRPPARLHVILARDVPKAVVIRRGPTAWTRLSLWHTDTDTFEHGQWFKGTIYPDRSDLAPNGRLFIYYAGKQTGYTIDPHTSYDTSWIAISKPPYFTALALWNVGTTYCPGGLFMDDQTVWLPFSEGDEAAHPDHPPQGIDFHTGKPLGTPPFFYRLERDGWTREAGQEAVPVVWWVPKRGQQSMYWSKQPPTSSFQLVLERRMIGYHITFSYFVVHPARQTITTLDDFAWADWDHNGRLVGARRGQILVMNPEAPNDEVTVLADLNDQRPDPQPAPDWAQHW
ncbi:MAG: hypothetical protein K8J31_06900 [Anaerolineae bacterium]|nr:hypothetical protein [Anaerolineae bacterium]